MELIDMHSDRRQIRESSFENSGSSANIGPQKLEIHRYDGASVGVSPLYLEHFAEGGCALYYWGAVTMRHFAFVGVLLLWFSSFFAMAADQDVRFVDAIPVISGAVLADRFDQPEIDRRLWHRPDWLKEHNPYIAVEPEHGWLHMSGVSHASGENFQYVGLISNNFRETDVVLVARIRVRSAFEKECRIQHIVHLCSGDWPDFFTEVVFRKIRSGPPVCPVATSIAFSTSRGTRNTYSRLCQRRDVRPQNGTKL
jgi:hypothetical protein